MIEPTARAIIFLLSDGPLRRQLSAGCPQGVFISDPLEALAELAAAVTPPRAFVAASATLGHRGPEIMSAARLAQPQAELFLIGSPADEPAGTDLAAEAVEVNAINWTAEVAEVNDSAAPHFVLPQNLGALLNRINGHNRTAPAGLDHHRSAAATAADSEDSPEQLPTESHSNHAALADFVGQYIETLSLLAHRSPAELAAEGTAALLKLDDLAGAAIVSSASLASPAGAAAIRAASPTSHAGSGGLSDWRQVNARSWLFTAPSAEPNRYGLKIESRDRPLSPALLAELRAPVRMLLALYESALEREAAVKLLSTDAETGLASRRYFDRYLSSLCRRAAEKRHEFTLALFECPEHTASAPGAAPVLADRLREKFPEAKLARLEPRLLAALFIATPTDQARSGLEKFSRELSAAWGRTAPAVAAVVFPWHGGQPEALLQAALETLDESRRDPRRLALK